MFAYLAGCTDLGFATSILIGPQRQTALLAKQAAEVDLLCGGRFRLGLGIGWNKLEYDALGMPFEERAAILEEQVAVLRALWTERSVTDRRPLPPHPGLRASRRRRCSDRSPSGSAATRRPRCGGWAASPTAGSPWCGPGGGLEAALETHPRGRRRGRA